MEDTLRILVATDNHLGVWESDPVRGNDSFDTFDEIFRIGKQHSVDFVLLGGDLFHENKPSRNSVVKAVDILSKHCLGDGDILFEILSDQKVNFTTGRVNYENPNFNIGLPVFTIHGNHDDPSAVDNTSAVDILASANLVNYFGKTTISGSGSGGVKISPILIRKGNTKLALYGLGNIRDERMCRLFNTPNGVEWARPVSNPIADVEDWVNVFVLHQNRVPHAQGAKNIVRESHLPKFLDVVIWGHEHECITEVQSSAASGGAFSVLQPGSSVATALSEGESRKKHVFLLEIRQKKWRTVKIPLETVRPFVFDSVALSHQSSVNPGNPDSVVDFLSDKVDQMISLAGREASPNGPTLPLIRCRVDYSGFSTINTQTFAQQFVDKVANPQDVLLWQKSAVRRRAAANGAMLQAITPADAETRIEDLIGEHLNEELRILPEQELAHALNEYVQKDEKSALVETVKTALKETQQDAERRTKDASKHVEENQESEMILKAILSAAGFRREKIVASRVVNAAKDKINSSVPAANNNTANSRKKKPKSTGTQTDDIEDLSASSGESTGDEDMSDAIDNGTAPPRAKRVTRSSAKQKTKEHTRKKQKETDSDAARTPDSGGQSRPAPSMSRISTRVQALNGLRASRKTGKESSMSKWGSFKKH